MKEILALLVLVLVLGLHLLDQALENPGHLVLVGIHLGQLVRLGCQVLVGLDEVLGQSLDILLHAHVDLDHVLDRLEQIDLDLVVACHLALGRLGLVRGGWCLGG